MARKRLTYSHFGRHRGIKKHSNAHLCRASRTSRTIMKPSHPVEIGEFQWFPAQILCHAHHTCLAFPCPAPFCRCAGMRCFFRLTVVCCAGFGVEGLGWHLACTPFMRLRRWRLASHAPQRHGAVYGDSGASSISLLAIARCEIAPFPRRRPRPPPCLSQPPSKHHIAMCTSQRATAGGEA